MAFLDLYSEIRGSVPKLPQPLAKTLVNRAYQDIKRQNLWSFQLYESNWIAPAQVSAGTATVVQGSNQVTFDVAGGAAIDASITAYNPINQRQFRIGVGTICNIIAWDSAGRVATLDRGYPDPGGATLSYRIYQVYYPAPFQDHRSLMTVRDMVSFVDLDVDKNKAWLDERDPQRTYFYFPTHVIPYLLGVDSANTATYQFPTFELWGAPLSNRAYQIYGIRKGVDLVNNSDTLPPAITEEAIVALAKFYAYEWAEANKGAIPRNQGPDFKFLMGETKARYNELFKKLRQQDREYVDNWFSVRRSALFGKYWAVYNSVSGTAFPGAYMGE